MYIVSHVYGIHGIAIGILILPKPHTALRRLAVKRRIVFGGAPCMRPYEYRHTEYRLFYNLLDSYLYFLHFAARKGGGR